MSTPVLPLLMPLDTSGPQTGESQIQRRVLSPLGYKNGFFIAPFSSGLYEIAEASGVQQGTKIVLHLKEDCKEFSSEDRVKGVKCRL